MRRLTRRRAVAALAVAATALAGTPALATGSAAGTLVLRGRGAVSADLTLARPVGVLPLRLAAAGAADGWSWHGCGRIRGFYLAPVAGDVMNGVGAVEFADLRFAGPAPAPTAPEIVVPRLAVPLGARAMAQREGQPIPPTEPVTLPAGRYRAYLLGEGSCEVRVPLRGLGATVRATATRAAALQWKVSDLDAVGALTGTALPRAGLANAPVAVRPRTFAFSLLHWLYYSGNGIGSAPSQTTAYDECVEAEPGPACSPRTMAGTAIPARAAQRSRLYYRTSFGDPYVSSTGPQPLFSIPDVTQFATWYAPGWLAPGEDVAKASTAVVGTATTVQAVMFALDL